MTNKRRKRHTPEQIVKKIRDGGSTQMDFEIRTSNGVDFVDY